MTDQYKTMLDTVIDNGRSQGDTPEELKASLITEIEFEAGENDLTKKPFCMDLDYFLTDKERENLPFKAVSANSAEVTDFLRACKAANGSAVYVGTKDSCFPEPISLTSEEMEEYIDFWVKDPERMFPEGIESRDEVSEKAYDAAIEIPEFIVRKTLARIQKQEIAEH